MAALTAILMALDAMMAQVLQQGGGASHQVRFARECAERVALARRRLDRGMPPALDPSAERWVQLLARSMVIAKRFAVWGGVAEGLGEFLLGVTAARLLAAPAGPTVTPAELGPPYAHWRRFVAIPMTSHLLRRARPALLDLFLHAPRSRPLGLDRQL